MTVFPYDIDKLVVSPVLIGRAQELTALEHALHLAQRGTGQIIIITGEAGVGKSRLLAEIRRAANSLQFVTLQGYCFERDSSFPYAPWVDALRTYLAQRTPLEISTTLGPLASEIVKLVPEVALSLPDLRPTPALDPEAEKRRLFETLTQFFIRLAETHPLLIILEDLHWSDETSLDLLHLFARRLSTLSILLLLSYRREEAPSPLKHLIAQFNRQRLLHEITLTPLTRDGVGLMLRAIFDLPHPVKAEFLDLLYLLTEGNPFFLEESLKALIAAGEIYQNAGRWERKPIVELHVPRSVQEAVRQRLERLSEPARRVLTLAAGAGRRFDFTLLQELIEMNAHSLLGIMKELVAAQLIVEESVERFSFRHALTREAVYASLLRRERQVLHQQVAETMERVYADALDAHVADLAYHFYEAGVWSKALEYSRRAGEKAQSLYAPREAIAHLTRALEAASQMSLPGQRQLLQSRGKAYETAGDFDAARSDYQEALHMAQATDDRAAEWEGLIDLGFLWAARDYNKTGEYFQRALDLARAMADPKRHAHSLNRLGNWYANVEQPGEGLRYHQEALEIFQRLDDRRGLVETLDLMGMTSQLNSDLIGSHSAYQRAISLWREFADRSGMASSLASLPLCAPSYLKNLDVPATSLAEAARAGEEAVKLAREIGWHAGEAYAQLILAMCLGPLGEYARALDVAHASLTLAEEIGHHQWTTGAHAALGMLYLDLLAFDAARSHLEQALALARQIGSRVWTDSTTPYLTLTWAAQGEFERAEAILNEVLASDTPMQTQSQRLCWYARGKLELARGEADTALRIADGLISLAPNLRAGTVIPRLWKLRGEALAALGNAHQAETVLQAAQQAAFEQGARSLLWRIHAALGKLYQTQARRDEAKAEFSAARQVIEQLADGVTDEALRRTFVERATATMPRITLPSAARIKKERSGGLTAREREVVMLIAQGKSNRQIADELVVGVRTVEAHITRILNKLGFSSRTQIAAWAAEKGWGRRDPQT